MNVCMKYLSTILSCGTIIWEDGNLENGFRTDFCSQYEFSTINFGGWKFEPWLVRAMTDWIKTNPPSSITWLSDSTLLLHLDVHFLMAINELNSIFTSNCWMDARGCLLCWHAMLLHRKSSWICAVLLFLLVLDSMFMFCKIVGWNNPHVLLDNVFCFRAEWMKQEIERGFCACWNENLKRKTWQLCD